MKEVDTTPTSSPMVPQEGNRLVEVASLFLRLGFTSFGGPAAHIAMMRQEIVQRRKWISDERFLDLISIVNLIPGPNSTQLAIYLGYVRAGWLGLILAGVCFIGPAMLMVLALAWFYVTYGALPQVSWLLYGIKAAVIGIIAYALWGLCRTILKRFIPIVLALLILVLYLLGFNPLLLLVIGGLVYAFIRWIECRRAHTTLSLTLFFPWSNRDITGRTHTAYTGFRAWLTANVGMKSVGILAVVTQISLLTLFLTFFKLGAVVYGSGYTILAYLRDDLVLHLRWLTDQQLLDAVSIGQFTPGPVFTTATFVGYLIAGWQGALLATLGIFLPSFIFIALIHPIAGWLRRSSWASAVLDGVNIAALALMTGVLVQLGRSALIDVVTWAIALVSLVILLRFKMNSVWLILGGALIGVVRFLV